MTPKSDGDYNHLLVMISMQARARFEKF